MLTLMVQEAYLSASRLMMLPLTNMNNFSRIKFSKIKQSYTDPEELQGSVIYSFFLSCLLLNMIIENST